MDEIRARQLYENYDDFMFDASGNLVGFGKYKEGYYGPPTFKEDSRIVELIPDTQDIKQIQKIDKCLFVLLEDGDLFVYREDKAYSSDPAKRFLKVNYSKKIVFFDAMNPIGHGPMIVFIDEDGSVVENRYKHSHPSDMQIIGGAKTVEITGLGEALATNFSDSLYLVSVSAASLYGLHLADNVKYTIGKGHSSILILHSDGNLSVAFLEPRKSERVEYQDTMIDSFWYSREEISKFPSESLTSEGELSVKGTIYHLSDPSSGSGLYDIKDISLLPDYGTYAYLRFDGELYISRKDNDIPRSPFAGSSFKEMRGSYVKDLENNLWKLKLGRAAGKTFYVDPPNPSPFSSGVVTEMGKNELVLEKVPYERELFFEKKDIVSRYMKSARSV